METEPHSERESEEEVEEEREISQNEDHVSDDSSDDDVLASSGDDDDDDEECTFTNYLKTIYQREDIKKVVTEMNKEPLTAPELSRTFYDAMTSVIIPPHSHTPSQEPILPSTSSTQSPIQQDILAALHNISSKLQHFTTHIPTLPDNTNAADTQHVARQIAHWSSLFLSMFQNTSTSIPQPLTTIPQPSSVPLPQPSIALPSTSIPQPLSSVALPQPSMSLPSTSIPQPLSSVALPQPSMSLSSTSIPQPLSSVPLPQPSMALSSTSVPLPPTSISQPLSSVPLPQPSMALPSTYVQLPPTSIPQPLSSVPLPPTSIPQPLSSVPLSSTSIPQPLSSVPLPPMSILQPSTSIPQPLSSVQLPPTSIPLSMPPASVPLASSPNQQIDAQTVQVYREYGAGHSNIQEWLLSLHIPRNVDSLQQIKDIWEHGGKDCPPLKTWTPKMRRPGKTSHSSIFNQRKKVYNTFQECCFKEDQVYKVYKEVKPGKLYKILSSKGH